MKSLQPSKNKAACNKFSVSNRICVGYNVMCKPEKQHDNTQSDVYSICHVKTEINGLSLRLAPHSTLIFHALAVALSHYFQKQTFGNGPTSEVSVRLYVSLDATAPFICQSGSRVPL